MTWWTAHLQRMAVDLAAIAGTGKAGYAHVKQKLDALGPEYAPLRGMVNEIRSAKAAAKEVRDEATCS